MSDVMHDLDWDLADRMRKALRVGNVGVQEMADHLEMSRNSLSRYINGRGDPDARTLRLWALRCGVPYGWLRDGTLPGPNGPGGTSECAPWDSNPDPSDYGTGLVLMAA